MAVVTLLVTSLVIGRFVSRLRQMVKEARSSVNRALIDAEERERVRIARDLHDDVGQRMALLVNRLEQLRTDISNPTVDIVTTIDELHEDCD